MLTVKHRKAIADGTYDVERELASSWRNLDASKQAEFQERFDALKKAQQEGKEDSSAVENKEEVKAEQADEDVEMADEPEEAEQDAENSAAGGFTAINQS